MTHQQNTHVFKDGCVTLYQRDDHNNPMWQARIRHPEVPGLHRRFSTRTSSLTQAKKKAFKEFDRLQFRVEDGLPVFAKKMSKVVSEWLAYERERQARGEFTSNRLEQKEFSAAFISEYFDDTEITEIKRVDIERYYDWRQNYWVTGPGSKSGGDKSKRHLQRMKDKKLKASTLGLDKAALSMIFEYAIEKRYIHSKPKMEVKQKKEKSSISFFTLTEYRELVNKLRKWRDEAGRVSDKNNRARMLYKVIVMAMTGMRPPEANNLKWKHVSKFRDGEGNPYLRLSVFGKSKERRLICDIKVLRYLRMMADVYGNTDPEAFVFGYADGTQPRGGAEANYFKRALNDIGMRDDEYGVRRTLYSLRHTFATFRLVYGRDRKEDLADNMGTSVNMIEQHYSHALLEQKAASLTRVKSGKVAERLRDMDERRVIDLDDFRRDAA